MDSSIITMPVQPELRLDPNEQRDRVIRNKKNNNNTCSLKVVPVRTTASACSPSRGSTSQTSSSAMTEKMNGMGRRRTLSRIVAGNLMGHARKQADGSKLASDTTSDNLNRSSISNVNVKLENTFRVGPTDNERFESSKVEKVIKDILESRLPDVEYDRDLCINLSKELASEIKHRIKIFQWKRYKLVCHVTIGQNSGQGVQVVSRCVWDDKIDSYSCIRYNNKTLFAVAQCYGVYFE